MYTFIKRVIDIILSFLGIILSSPIWIITIIGILINDFGPVFYVADRIGKNNKKFKMLKFRSMKVLKSEEKESESIRANENRLFTWGRVIRKLKIDELPQLLNIFVGNMSIVGPRPVSIDQTNIFRVERYDVAKILRPGLTGPAALYDYIYGDKFDESHIDEYIEKVLPIRKELEIVYVKKISFFFDTWIFFQTAWCVICRTFGKSNKKLLNKLIKFAYENNNKLEKEDD